MAISNLVVSSSGGGQNFAFTVANANTLYEGSVNLVAGTYNISIPAANYSVTTFTGSNGAANASGFTASSVTGLAAGQFITGNGLAANTIICSIDGTGVYISPNMTSAASGTYTVFHRVTIALTDTAGNVVGAGFTNSNGQVSIVTSAPASKVYVQSSAAAMPVTMTFAGGSISQATSTPAYDTITATTNTYSYTGPVFIMAVGGGQGGNGASSNWGYGGGGGRAGELSGAFAQLTGGPYTVTVGAAGNGGYTDQWGVAGGDTSFGNLVSARGGVGPNSVGMEGGGSGGNSWAGYKGRDQGNPYKGYKAGTNGSGAGGSGGSGLGPSNVPGGSGIGTGGVGGNAGPGGNATGFGAGGGGAGHAFGNPGGAGSPGVVYVFKL